MKNSTCTPVLVSLGAALASVTASAAEAPPATVLPSMTVQDTIDSGYDDDTASTATKTDLEVRDVPQSIEVRDRQLLDDLGGTQNAYDVARTVAGAFNAENGQGDPGRNVPNFVFRGFNNNGSYLKDGHFINGWMSTTDMANVERVEFLKGPASFLYGGSIYTGDIGGVVNYVSKLPSATRVAAVDLTAGSHDFYRVTADLGGPATDSGKVLLRLNGAIERGDSFRDFATHDSQFVAPAVTLKLSDHDSLTLLTEFARSHEVPARGLPLDAASLAIDPARNFIDPDYTRTDIHAHNLAARFVHSMRHGWHLALDITQTGSHANQFGSYLYYNPGDVSTLAGSHWRLYNDQFDVDARLSGRFRTGSLQHDLLLGFNTVRNRYHADSEFGWNELSIALPGSSLDALVLPPPGSLSTLYNATAADPGTFRWNNDARGAYVQDLVTVGAGFKLLLGARQDRFSNVTAFDGSFGTSDDRTDNSHVSPRLGLVYQPGRTASIYAVWAQAFSPNTGIELDGSAPPPELGELAEAGIKLAARDGLELHAAWYSLERKHMAFPDPADPNQIAVLVAGMTRSRGLELDLNGRLTDALRVSVAASLMRAWISDGEPGGSLLVGSEFPGVPRKTLNLWGVYSFGSGRTWEAGGGLYWAGAAWADAANTFRVPAIVQLDAMATRRLGDHSRLQVNLKNLTNRRNDTSNGWGWINPGDPRSVYATFRHEF